MTPTSSNWLGVNTLFYKHSLFYKRPNPLLYMCIYEHTQATFGQKFCHDFNGHPQNVWNKKNSKIYSLMLQHKFWYFKQNICDVIFKTMLSQMLCNNFTGYVQLSGTFIWAAVWSCWWCDTIITSLAWNIYWTCYWRKGVSNRADS